MYISDIGARSKLLAPHLASILTHPQDFPPLPPKKTHTHTTGTSTTNPKWSYCPCPKSSIWYLRDVWFHGVASRFTFVLFVLSAAQFPRIPQGRSRFHEFHRTDVLILSLLYRCSGWRFPCNSTTLIFSKKPRANRPTETEILIGCKLL